MKQKRRTFRLWAVIFWLLIWQLAAMILDWAYPHGKLLIASPLAVWERFFALAGSSEFRSAIFASTAHILGGFLLSCALAVAFSALSARFPRVMELLAPPVAIIKAVPVASFIILALIWVSSDNLALFISALIAFPPLYLNMLEGIRTTDASLLEMAQVFRIPFLRRVRGIYLPHVSPYFRSASSVALGLSWKAGTAAEVIGMSGGTIGERLYNAKIYFQTPDLFVWTAVIVLLSVFFEKLFLLAVDKFIKRMGARWN